MQHLGWLDPTCAGASAGKERTLAHVIVLLSSAMIQVNKHAKTKKAKLDVRATTFRTIPFEVELLLGFGSMTLDSETLYFTIHCILAVS
jgi:hypothetical protein